jgi:DNA-binding response OmpR family regulator
MKAKEMNSARRALVIDDDDVARELLVCTIKPAGFTTFELPSPIGATQLLLREDIRLLVLDIQMPDMSGDKLAKLLRKNEKLQSLAILLVSGADDADLGQLAAEVHADGVIHKRDIRTELVGAAMRALRGKRNGSP